jgi:hypothetical protein
MPFEQHTDGRGQAIWPTANGHSVGVLRCWPLKNSSPERGRPALLATCGVASRVGVAASLYPFPSWPGLSRPSTSILHQGSTSPSSKGNGLGSTVVLRQSRWMSGSIQPAKRSSLTHAVIARRKAFSSELANTFSRCSMVPGHLRISPKLQDNRGWPGQARP